MGVVSEKHTHLTELILVGSIWLHGVNWVVEVRFESTNSLSAHYRHTRTITARLTAFLLNTYTTYPLLLATLLATCCLLLLATFMLATLLLTTFLLTAYCLLLTAYCLLPSHEKE